jgi:hypothetical protein
MRHLPYGELRVYSRMKLKIKVGSPSFPVRVSSTWSSALIFEKLGGGSLLYTFVFGA